MPRSQPQFQEVDGLRVPLGGVNGYKGVRGKQGRKKDKYQGTTPRKKHRTGPKDTPKEARLHSRSCGMTSSSGSWRSAAARHHSRLPAPPRPKRSRSASTSATC